jgi:hypothetical protein
VNSSRVLSLAAVGIVIIITVPLKLSDFGVVQERLSRNLEQASAALLRRQAFEVDIDNRFGLFVISAKNSDCRLQIYEAAAEGFNAAAIEAESPKNAQSVFEYRGKLWKSQPTLYATISKNWNRLKWRLGVDSSWSPMILIVAVGRCAIETLPWNELASIRAE